MKIERYYQKLNEKSQDIFATTLQDPEVLSKAHSTAVGLHVLAGCVKDECAEMLQVACSQIESSSLALSFGLYRSAFTSLRLSLDFSLGAIFFSTNRLVHKEWLNGVREADLKWSVINGPDAGVLSARFAAAFFPELKDLVYEYRERASALYRKLSEYVHGNSDTWKATGIALSHKNSLQDAFLQHLNEMSEIVKFAFCCRYLREFSNEELDRIEAIIISDFTHIEPIRLAFGGPKDAQ